MIKKISKWVLFVLSCLIVLLIISAVVHVALKIEVSRTTAALMFFSMVALYGLIIKKDIKGALGAFMVGVITFLFGFIGVIIGLIICLVYLFIKKKKGKEARIE